MRDQFHLFACFETIAKQTKSLKRFPNNPKLPKCITWSRNRTWLVFFFLKGGHRTNRTKLTTNPILLTAQLAQIGRLWSEASNMIVLNNRRSEKGSKKSGWKWPSGHSVSGRTTHSTSDLLGHNPPLDAWLRDCWLYGFARGLKKLKEAHKWRQRYVN